MKLSNLRVEHRDSFTKDSQQVYVVCDLSARFTDVKLFWFSVDEKHADLMSSDVYDAFLVSMLYPAMYYNEDIEIEGNVSERLYHNLCYYVQAMVKAFDPKFHNIKISVKGFAEPEKNDVLHVGTGFSGGVDSFATLYDNFFTASNPNYKIDSLFFFHLGQYGNVKDEKTWSRVRSVFEITKQFASEIGVSAIIMNTNMFDFYLPHWEFDAGVLCRIAGILIFQKSLKRYYISSARSYQELIMINTESLLCLSDVFDTTLMPLLSLDRLEIMCDGAQYTRTEKTKTIAKIPLARKYLNVCVNSNSAIKQSKATNCSYCPKCLRTMMALESLGVLEEFRDVFDIARYQKLQFRYKCEQVCLYNNNAFARDNVDFARSKGKKLPNKLVAYVVYHFWIIGATVKKHLKRFLVKH